MNCIIYTVRSKHVFTYYLIMSELEQIFINVATCKCHRFSHIHYYISHNSYSFVGSYLLYYLQFCKIVHYYTLKNPFGRNLRMSVNLPRSSYGQSLLSNLRPLDIRNIWSFLFIVFLGEIKEHICVLNICLICKTIC